MKLCLHRFAHIGALPEEKQNQHIAELPHHLYSMMQQTGIGYWQLLTDLLGNAPDYGCILNASHLKPRFKLYAQDRSFWANLFDLGSEHNKMWQDLALKRPGPSPASILQVTATEKSLGEYVDRAEEVYTWWQMKNIHDYGPDLQIPQGWHLLDKFEEHGVHLKQWVSNCSFVTFQSYERGKWKKEHTNEELEQYHSDFFDAIELLQGAEE